MNIVYNFAQSIIERKSFSFDIPETVTGRPDINASVEYICNMNIMFKEILSFTVWLQTKASNVRKLVLSGQLESCGDPVQDVLAHLSQSEAFSARLTEFVEQADTVDKALGQGAGTKETDSVFSSGEGFDEIDDAWLFANWERITRRDKNGQAIMPSRIGTVRAIIESLAKFEDMLEEGRLIPLPVADGGTVYLLDDNDEVFEAGDLRTLLTFVDENGQELEIGYGEFVEMYLNSSAVFMTREEAEEAEVTPE